MGLYFLVLEMVFWEAYRHLRSYECICTLLYVSKTRKYREFRWNTYFLNRAQVLKAELLKKHKAWCFQPLSKCEINFKMITESLLLLPSLFKGELTGSLQWTHETSSETVNAQYGTDDDRDKERVKNYQQNRNENHQRETKTRWPSKCLWSRSWLQSQLKTLN